MPLNTLYEKVKNEESFSKKIYNRGLYRYSDRIYVDHEYEMKTISDRRLGSNAFEKLPKLFYSKNQMINIIIFKYMEEKMEKGNISGLEEII